MQNLEDGRNSLFRSKCFVALSFRSHLVHVNELLIYALEYASLQEDDRDDGSRHGHDGSVFGLLGGSTKHNLD